ncbi:MAG: hypothetical protein AAGC93_12770 [Cyanobacteria bacterium P01_F01_bin.53]
MHRRLLNVIELKKETQEAIAHYLLNIALNGYDVQDFNPTLPYQGTKRSLAQQQGYYPSCNLLRLKQLGYAVADILLEHQEHTALDCFKSYRELFSSAGISQSKGAIPYIQKIQFLPEDSFAGIDPAHLVSPNGLRIPDELDTWREIQEYSAKLLLPKLLLAAICSLHNQRPWMDLDMDLQSTMHTMRPDPDKVQVNAGYGGGYIKQHTDGYWNQQSNVPLMVVFLGISNPNQEPTYFIPVEAIFRVPAATSPIYEQWCGVFQDLIPAGQTPEDFIEWVVFEAFKPQFSFVMGVLGGDAQRGVYETPLLEKDPNYGGYLFRAKSTFQGTSANALTVVEFTNRMIAFLSEQRLADAYQEISLSPGEVYLALNGAGLQLNAKPAYEADGYAYWMKGAATIHGRHQLTAVNGKIDRTLARGNSLYSPERTFYTPEDGAEHLLAELRVEGSVASEAVSLNRTDFFRADCPQGQGIVTQFLQQGVRGNALKR